MSQQTAGRACVPSMKFFQLRPSSPFKLRYQFFFVNKNTQTIVGSLTTMAKLLSPMHCCGNPVNLFVLVTATPTLALAARYSYFETILHSISRVSRLNDNIKNIRVICTMIMKKTHYNFGININS